MESAGRSSPSSAVAGRLPEAIRAARAGQREQARELLLQIVEEDENNEAGWLWLSGVVETDEDRRVCLENVLALNPDNESARRGLAKLGLAPTAEGEAAYPGTEEGKMNLALPEVQVMRREIVPPSPAAAVLYPERHVQEWEWQDTTTVKQAELPGFAPESTFDDVWSRNQELCAYCAGVLGFDEQRCPHCGRKLTVSRFRHEKPSANMHIYWVLLLGAAQLHFIQGIITYIANPNGVAMVIVHGVASVILGGLTAAVYLRQFWAYVASVILLSLLLVIVVTSAVDAQGVGETVNNLINNEAARDLAEGVTTPLVAKAVGAVQLLLLAAILLALFYGIFFAGPDFARDTVREVAEVDKGQRFASDYYAHGQQHAKQGRWATAVLYYQRASAQEPHQVYYQRALGQAYAVLGFYQRSLDVLESAEKMSSNQTLQAEIRELIRRVKEYQAKTG